VYEGPPFKFKEQLQNHSKYVQSIRYSPDGEMFASGGFDGQVFLFTGKDYSLIGELGSPAHAGGVYAVSWSPDSKRLLTCSGDRTTKIWDVETKVCIQTFTMGDDLLDQQVSCLWQGQHILSVSLSGFINYLDEKDSSKPIRVIKGHNKSITSLVVNPTTDPPSLYTGSHDGLVIHWNSKNGANDQVHGTGHNNQVQDMKYRESTGQLITLGLDDRVRAINLSDKSFSPDVDFKVPSQPRCLSFLPNSQQSKALIAGYSGIIVVDLDRKTVDQNFPVSYEPSSISVHPKEAVFAVGGNRDNKVHIYSYSDCCDSIEAKIELEHRDCITDVAYSPDGQYLAVTDANRKVVLYSASTYELAHNVEWGYHTARVNCLAWSPNSLYLASGSLDASIIIWDVQNPSKHVSHKSG